MASLVYILSALTRHCSDVAVRYRARHDVDPNDSIAGISRCDSICSIISRGKREMGIGKFSSAGMKRAREGCVGVCCMSRVKGLVRTGTGWIE